MKKLTIAALFAASFSVSAVQAAGFNGAYVGFDAGYTTLKSNGLASTIGSELEGSNVNFGVQLGYGATISGNFYLGGEVGLRNNAGDFGSKTISGTSTTVSLKTSNAKMFSLLPGFVVSPNTLIYARIARMNVDTEATITNPNSSSTGSGNANIYGLGVDYLMTSNLSVKAEANKISASDTDGTSFNVGVNYRF
jgi:hypothetical protein